MSDTNTDATADRDRLLVALADLQRVALAAHGCCGMRKVLWDGVSALIEDRDADVEAARERLSEGRQ